MPIHIATDELADAEEGLVDSPRAAEIAQHVAECPFCADSAAAVHAVSTTLAEQPAPVMPPDVFHRLSEVVAAESRRRSAHPQAPRYESPFGPAKPTLGTFGDDLVAKPKSKLLPKIVIAFVFAAAIGFAGYVLSATAGMNEPQATAPVIVDSKNLEPTSRAIAENHPQVHAFSNAWRCVGSVTDGRITGLVDATVDGVPGYLVYAEGPDGTTIVSTVTGCATNRPTAGPSTTLR